MPLSFLLKTAWRNILRHRRRSLVTLLAVVSGVTGVILFGGFVEANYIGLRESVIRSQYGHFQVFRAGYQAHHRQDPERYRLDPQTTGAVIELLGADPRVVLTARRLEFTGLLGNERQSQAALVRGVEPEAESLINSALTIIEGEDLSGTDPEEALLGEGLAQALDAQPGDRLTLLSTTVGGVMNAVDVVVQGIFRSFAAEYDARAMMMDLTQAQLLLATDAVDNVVVLLDRTPDTRAVAADLTASGAAQGLDLEIARWDELATFYQKVVDLYDGFFLFIILVIAVVVLFGIANTMLITVMERTTEIGTLRALGTRRQGIVAQFLTEGLLLALLSSLVGVALGVALSHFITGLEVMMPPPPGSSKGFPLRIEQVPGVWLASIAGVLLIAFFATVFPAMQAARRSIVGALRHV
jgi:putative ABC transport system permease protein